MSVRDGLLSILGGGPTYGFQLKTQFEATTGGVWPLNVGQVYTTLDRLERDGLVTVEEIDGQKIYQLTEAGDDELDAWWQATPGDEPPPRDELVLKLLLALPHGRDHALDVLSHQRNALAEVLAHHQRATVARRADHSADGLADLAAELVADAVVMRTESEIRWLDRCEARIVAAPDPDPEDGANGHRSWRTRSAQPKVTRR